MNVIAPEDRQAQLGQTIYYTFEVINKGTVKDTYRLTLEADPELPTGQIPRKITLEPGENRDVPTSIELALSSDATTFRLILTAVSTTDPTTDDEDTVITRLEAPDPEVLEAPDPEVTFTKTVDKTKVVPGEQITYTLYYKNTGNVPFKNAYIEDRLPEQVIFETSTVAVELVDEKTLKIPLPSVVYQDQYGKFRITVRIREDIPPRGQIVNTALLSAEGLPTPAVAQARSSIEVPDLSLEKSSNQSEVTVGDILLYTITITNNGSGTALAAKVIDELPSVLRYIPGTSVVNGSLVSDPERRGNQQLVWELGDIRVGDQIVLRYQTSVIVGAKSGKYKNKAIVQAENTAGQPLTFGPARSEVWVRRAGRKISAEIQGIVFQDNNANGYQDPDESGLPGIEVLLVRDFVKQLSDKEGEFFFGDLDPGEQAIALDETKLPDGYWLTTESTVLVSLTEGDRGYVEFGLQSETPTPIKKTRLEGRVFFDKNRNERYDEGEALLKEFVAILDRRLKTRGREGKFIFSHIEAGSHSVEIRYDEKIYNKAVTLHEGKNWQDFPIRFTGVKVTVSETK